MKGEEVEYTFKGEDGLKSQTFTSFLFKILFQATKNCVLLQNVI